CVERGCPDWAESVAGTPSCAAKSRFPAELRGDRSFNGKSGQNRCWPLVRRLPPSRPFGAEWLLMKAKSLKPPYDLDVSSSAIHRTAYDFTNSPPALSLTTSISFALKLVQIW